MQVVGTNQIALSSGIFKLRRVVLPKRKLSVIPKKIRNFVYADAKHKFYSFSIKVKSKDFKIVDGILSGQILTYIVIVKSGKPIVSDDGVTIDHEFRIFPKDACQTYFKYESDKSIQSGMVFENFILTVEAKIEAVQKTQLSRGIWLNSFNIF